MSAAESNKREPMSKVDTAWLRMESPTNLMMISGVLMFHDRLDIKKVRRLAGLGVDHISVGALTHSAPSLDLSLEFI